MSRGNICTVRSSRVDSLNEYLITATNTSETTDRISTHTHSLLFLFTTNHCIRDSHPGGIFLLMCALDYLDSDQLNQLGFTLLVDSNRYFFTAQLDFPALPEPSWNHGGFICVGDHVTELGKPSVQTKTDFPPLLSGRCLRLSLYFLLTHWSEIKPNTDRRQVSACRHPG